MSTQTQQPPVRVLFLCTGNSARSQMAEGLTRAMARQAVDVHSAGTQPRPQVHPLAVRALAEAGLDISQQRPKALDVARLREHFDFVITVCDRAKERCPVWPGAREHIHWSFDDPAAAEGDEEAQLRVFRRVRDELRQRITLFLLANHITTAAPLPARSAH